jgi:uncharacterized repeat protein (TIGR03943 family)
VTVTGGTITVLVGTVLLRLTLTGTYRRYVRVGMGPWLAAAGLALVVLGIVVAVGAMRGAPSEPHGHRGDAGHGRVGWLLLAPIAALLLVAPPTLGSYGVDRGATVDVRPGAAVFEALRAGRDPVPMSLLEFAQRSFDHDGASFAGATVALTGFVAGSEQGGFRLARYQIACCAADAAPVVVRVTGIAGVPPPRDRWVTVTGTFRPSPGEIPVLAATAVRDIPTPDDPYE